MYNAGEIAVSIKMLTAKKKITLKKMLDDLGLSKNFMVNMANGYMPVSDNLAKIADYLDCSVDYLLGRTENPDSHKQ